MKKIIAILLATLVMVSIGTMAAPTANQGALKIGVINVGKLVQNSPQVKAAAKKLKAKFKSRQDAIAKVQKTLAADEAKLKRDKAVLKQSDIDDLKVKIVNEKRHLKNLQQEYVQAAQLAQRQVMGETLRKIDTILQNIAKKEHYDLILERNNVAYSSAKVDITDQVLTALNKQ